MFDICIIGGGPAGMSAAITAKFHNPQLSVCIIEKNPSLGKKIFATGNGKCNLSNQTCQEFVEVFKFFNQIGIFTRTDEAGRMYPASEQASDVVLALTNALQNLNIEIQCNTIPKNITKNENGFTVELADGKVTSKKLLIATGGKAGPQYGNLGEGYAYSKQLGHHVTRTYPVLSPLECIGNFQLLKGIRAKGNVSLLFNGNPVATESGEIQFTEDGISGICVFNLSRFVRLDPRLSLADAIKQYTVSIDFVPRLSLIELEQCIKDRAAWGKCKISDILLTMVHPGISSNILESTVVSQEKDVSELSGAEIKRIAHSLKQWECGLTGVKGWKKAQCTGGGVPFTEVDDATGESLLTKDLYFAGEVLDYDGPSGGFNLHFAWDSGIKAGKAMSHEAV